MSFHDVLPADVKMALACQPSPTSAPAEESEPRSASAPRAMSVPEQESGPGSTSAPDLRSEPSETRAPSKGSAKRREPKWRAKSKILAGREPGKPASWGFVCGSCKYPVDAHLRGEHAPGCKNSMHNASLLEGAEEFAHLVQ